MGDRNNAYAIKNPAKIEIATVTIDITNVLKNDLAKPEFFHAST